MLLKCRACYPKRSSENLPRGSVGEKSLGESRRSGRWWDCVSAGGRGRQQGVPSLRTRGDGGSEGTSGVPSWRTVGEVGQAIETALSGAHSVPRLSHSLSQRDIPAKP